MPGKSGTVQQNLHFVITPEDIVPDACRLDHKAILAIETLDVGGSLAARVIYGHLRCPDIFAGVA